MASGNSQFNITIGANMDPSGVLGAVKQMQSAFNGLKLPNNLTTNMVKDFDKLKESLTKFEALAKQQHFSKADLKQLDTLQKEIDATFGHLIDSFDDLSGRKFYLDADYTKIQEAKQVVNQLKADMQSKLSEIKIDFTNAKGGTDSLGLNEMISGMERGVKSSKVLSTAMEEVKQSLSVGNFSGASAQIEDIVNKAGTLKGAGAGLLNTFKQWGLIDFSKPANELAKTDEGIDLLKQGLTKILPLFTQDSVAAQELAKQIAEAVAKQKDLEQTGRLNATNAMKEGAGAARELKEGMDAAGSASRSMANDIANADNQLKQLQQSTQYFFSLRNMFNLLKRGLKEAVQVVKELDAAMTKTAVVTNFSVGDMWAKLPEYTANANALGASVKDMYESATLYYQQGLEGNEVMNIATETMKMARIAGLDAADATDKMTAALRGFNMELNEASAQRVNDVYSNLAAKTASDVEELGSAMQRTASIAASAGMSFEGTAAFLAQAIETTREPAENIGTAMKTIVARFTEIKKNPLETIDVEGEEVSFNKVDTALQSIGVSLKDTNGQFRNLDEVFLDIAQRWDSLTQTQQRYIATIAAGSRQQSRFIAMMSNYDRTVQLMDYATNSAGASNEQFGKTMESLEAKINKFKNAWNAFLMGIMNDKWTKRIVDGATSILNVINNIINTLSFKGKAGLLKSGLSIFTAFTGLKFAGRGINALFGGLGNILSPNSKGTFKDGLKAGWGGAQASKITSPIVQAIHELIPHIDKTAAKDSATKQVGYKDLYKDTRNTFANLSKEGEYNLRGVATYANKQLTPEQQKVLFKEFAGLKHSMAKNLSSVMQAAGADPLVAKGLIKGFKKGDITAQDVLTKSGLLLSYDDKIAQQMELGGEEAAKQYQKSIREHIGKNGVKEQILAEAKQKKVANKDLSAYVNNALDEKARQRLYAKNPQTEELLSQNVKLNKWEQAANSFNKLGGSISSAGMSLQMLGNQLSAINPVLGEAISKVGGLTTTLGSLATGIGSIIAGGPPMWILAGAIVAVGTAFAVTQVKASRAKKAAEKVIDSYKKINEETQANISSLKQYQSQAEHWAQGVDENGYNISLSDDEYNQYLDAVEKIAAINPDIVEGYNAQGRAIININKALSETIALEKQRQDEALDEYLQQESGDKLIRARDVNNAYQKTTLQFDEKSVGGVVDKILKLLPSAYGASRSIPGLDNLYKKLYKLVDTTFDLNLFTKEVTPQSDNINSLINEMLKDVDSSEIEAALKKFNISFTDLMDESSEGHAAAVNQFLYNEKAIYSQFANLFPDKVMPENVGKYFDAIDEDATGLQEATAEITSWLQVYVSNLDTFNNIPDEMKSIIMSNLDKIAIDPQYTSIEQMQDAAKELIGSFDELITENSAYIKATEGITTAQQNFSTTLDADEYHDAIADDISALEHLRDNFLKSGDAVSQAAGEYINQIINQANKYTENGQYRLTEALNGMIGAIKSAEGALDAFKEATKTDFSTGADNMKSIYDTIFEGTHADAYGDKTFWTGAGMLLGSDTVDELNGEIGDVKQQLKKISPYLQEGEAGFANFWNDFESITKNLETPIAGLTWTEDGKYNIDRKQNPEVYAQIADAMDISLDLLMSMLHKGMQYAKITFEDADEVRAALGADEAAVKAGKDIYVKDEYLTSALYDAGYGNYASQQQVKDNLETQNVHVINPPEEFSKQAQKMGIDDIPKLIEVLGDTGQFSREELLQYANALFGTSEETSDKFATAFDNYIQHKDDPELAPIESIQDAVTGIYEILNRDRVRKGEVTEEDAKQAQEYYEKEVRGKKGVSDTAIQRLGKGLDESGNVLSVREFEAARLTAEAALRKAEQNVKDLEEAEAQANANGDKEAAEQAQEAKKWWEATVAEYQRNLETADINWAQAYIEQTKQYAVQEALENGMSVSQANNEAYNQALAEAAAALDLTVDDLKLQLNELNQPEGGEQQTQELNNSPNAGDGYQVWNQPPTMYNPPSIDYSEETQAKMKEMSKNFWPNLFNFLKPQVSHYEEEYGWTSPKKAEPKGTTKDDKGAGGGGTVGKIAAPELPDDFFRTDEINDAAQDLTSSVSETSGGLDKLAGFFNKIFNIKLPEWSNGGGKTGTSGSSSHTSTSTPAPKTPTLKGASLSPTITPKVDTSGITSAVNKATSKKPEMPVKVKDETQAGIQAIRRKITQNPVYMTVRTRGGLGGGGLASGINNTIPYRSVPQAGSLASGNKRGRLGPNNRGGMTLTGERGYEVAWFPDENRSAILGANGPQMVNLPKNVVVYNHEQSKEIMKKRAAISAGSMDSGSYYYKGSRGGGGGTTKAKNKGSSKSKTSKKQKNINNFSIEEVIRFDIDQTLEWLNSELNRREKDIEVALEKIGNVYDNITDDVNAQLAALKEIAQNNQDLADSYQRQLKAIDEGTYKEVISWTNNAGKSQEAIYDLSKYIYRDDDGVYKVDTDQIRKLTSNAEREAVFKAANGLISSLQSGLIKAQEAADDARQQMEELGRKVSETFYQWENELTEIYDLTQRIEDETSFTDRFMSQVELELSKLNTGFGVTAKSIENIRKVLLRNNDNIQRQIEDQQQMIAARQRELNRMLSSADEQERVDRFQNATGVDEATKAANIAWAEDQKKIADTALKYVTNIYRDIDGSVRYAIDWEGFNRDNANSPFNKETYDAIKDYLDDLNDAATEFNDSIKEQTDFIKDTYEALADYQKTVVDMEETLIKGVEEEIKNETDNAKKLSDSIRDQLKDLLDEVKRRLDERRKQEDNLKTERDISQKQQRLAALRADTAGGHQVEIAQLEKEIAEAQQNYGRTLEDQLLDRLQQQADEAAKQRERQIELAEKSNEINASTNKELVDLWLKNPEAYKEEIRSAWLEAQGYDEKGEAGQWALEQEFESEFAKLVTAVEQSGFNNVEQIFSATAEDVSTLVNLVNQLVNGKIGRDDNLAKDFNAQEDATIHNVISWETISKDAEGARIARESGGSATDARAHDFTLEDLIAGDFTPSELKEANYTAAELWNAGIQDVPTLKDAGYSAGDLKDAGATIQDILNSYGPEETRNAGFDVNDFDIAEINYELAKIAFTLDELANSDTRYAELAQLDLASLVPETEPEETPQPVAIPAVTYPYGKASATTGKIKSGSSGNQVKAIQWALRQMGYKGKNGKPLSIDGKFGANTVYAVKAFQKAMKITADGVVGNQTRAKFKAKGYSTGGLADYTGPAWLDGTPSKPELVLNAADTKNFLALRDVLSSAMKSTGAVNNSYGGDVTYEVNINVDKLTSDYDVDKVANRVKQIIVKDSSYRNVTQARNFR